MKKVLVISTAILGFLILIPWVLWFPSSIEPGYRHVTTWGSKGDQPGQFHDPTGIETYKSEVFVADSRNHRVQVFDLNGNFKRQFGSKEVLGRPMNMAIHNEKIYIADYWNDRIAVFKLEGAFIKFIGKPGASPGEFNSPGGVSVSSEGNLYIVDVYNQRIQEVAPDGQYIQQFGVTGDSGTFGGKLSYPTDIAISKEGNLFIADGYNDRIQVLSSEGHPLYKWGGPLAINISGTFNGWFAVVSSIALHQGNVFAADFYNNRVQKFKENGDFLTSFGSKGSQEAQFNHPFGVAVTEDGSVFVTDFGNNRIQKWRPLSAE